MCHDKHLTLSEREMIMFFTLSSILFPRLPGGAIVTNQLSHVRFDEI